MAKLKNRTPFAQVYNLEHEKNCTNQECRCTKVQVPIRELDKTTGRFGVRQESRRVCQSLSFQPGQVQEVDDRANECAEVVAAIARRDLVVVTESAQ